MATNRLKISLEIEPIVLLKCANKECRHNLANSSEGYIACNLKRLVIGSDGRCLDNTVIPRKK